MSPPKENNEPAREKASIPQTPTAPQIIQPRNVEAAPVEPAAQPALPETRYATPTPQVARSGESDSSEVPGPRFAFDPFAFEIDGPIPAMPTLPIVEAIEMTQNVVSREKAGTHYAWRLKPGPNPETGNTPQVDGTPENQPAQPAKQNGSEVQPVKPVELPVVADSQPQATETQTSPAMPYEEPAQRSDGSDWSDLEVVSDGNFESLGDSFVVQPGEVIYIDGNQGYDHIDVRSYSIEDATFQPGAILLRSDMLSVENEETPAPITIRHRGVAFAIFKGEVRVEL